MRRHTRLVLVVVLIAGVFAMGVHYEATYDSKWPYPDTDALAVEYEEYVGEQVFLFGTVETVAETEHTAQIRVEYSTGEFTMTVHDFDADVEPGGVVQVLGDLDTQQTMTASNVRVVNPAGSSTLYKYAVSLVGALLVVITFFRYWHIDWTTLSFEVRDG